MIGQCCAPLRRQALRRLLRFLAREGVDDARPPRVSVQQSIDLSRRGIPGGYADLQVWTVEAGDEHLRPTAEQPLDDVLPRNGIGRGREGAELGIWEMLRQFGEATVVRPEVVAPLGDAVRLVNGEPRRTIPGEAIQYVRLHEPFRRNVEQAQSTVAQLAVCLGSVRPRRGRIERARRHTVDAPRGYLVAHQGDERRHLDGQGLGRQSRKLVAQRLARAGRHYRQQCPNDFCLTRTEPVIAEGALQERMDGFESRQFARREVPETTLGILESV